MTRPLEPESPLFPEDAVGTTERTGEAIDNGRGRIFPCKKCGADLQFSIGQQSLQCPYCGSTEELQPAVITELHERDLDAMLERLQEWHNSGTSDQQAIGDHEVRCAGCGANVVFQGTLTSSSCPYCASPLQRDKVHDAQSRIHVDGVLPFLVPEARASANLRNWIQSLWFAPNEFKKRGANGKFNGVYLPYFTFDALTFTRWSGQRGDHYYVTVGSGKDERRERRTSWTWVSGEFQRFFDDVLVMAVRGMNMKLVQDLEPWPLGKCLPFNPEVLAGLYARTYDVELPECFEEGRKRVREALNADVRSRIGGDEQQISDMKVQLSAVTFKHILLPVWLLAYKYQDKTYQVMINAATGEVQGERPWSWVKITLAILAATAVVGTVFLLSQGR